MKKLAYVFPGQGSQYPGMGKALAAEYETAARVFETADARLGEDFSQLCFDESRGAELDLTWNAQPAIMAVSLALLAAAKEKGLPRPDYLAGHSLGEYTALAAAGVLTPGDALWLVRRRGRLMAEAVPPGQGGMAALMGATREQAETLCRAVSEFGLLQPANFNGGGQIVISGHTEAVAKAAERAGEFGIRRCVPLQVTGPFHSRLMAPAAEKLKEVLARIPFAEAGVPIIANVDAAPESAPAEIRERLIRQVSEAVLWEQTVLKLVELGVRVFVEIGPKRVLTGLIKKMNLSVRLLSVEDPASLNALDTEGDLYAE
jgi:[acyl-carrier-protein] S-malonyltransferase